MTVDIIDTVPALFLGPTSDCFTPYVGPREWSICHTTTKKQQHLKINWPITKWQVKDGCRVKQSEVGPRNKAGTVSIISTVI
jgi:hypothetical protein